jgi:Protein of unknown function (DUF3987)
MEDFFTEYIQYCGQTEVPAIFNRWAAITGLGAFLGRQYHFDHGHFNIYPNVYCMLIGSAGTRKGTAIKLMRKLLEKTGYNKFAAERTSKEKFLLDLAGEGGSDLLTPEQLLDQNLFGDASAKADCEMFVAIDEFNDFIGNGNIEFISMLGNMWDYHGLYSNRIKTGKSVEINNPTISIIGGNTPTGFSLAFPTDILGQGFFSRLLLIYADRTDRRITFPPPPPPEHTRRIVEQLAKIKSTAIGSARLTGGAEKLLDKIYQRGISVDDVRFESYSNRRFTHLLKLTVLCSAARASASITEPDVVYSNTILSAAEHAMPRALGEFGKAKHSDVSHKIIQLAESTHSILTFKEIWKHVSNDLEKMSDLGTLLQNLVAAEKLQLVPGNKGFLPKRKILEDVDSSMVDYSLLLQEERDSIK